MNLEIINENECNLEEQNKIFSEVSHERFSRKRSSDCVNDDCLVTVKKTWTELNSCNTLDPISCYNHTQPFIHSQHKNYCPALSLPFEVLLQIFSFLPAEGLINVSLVCQTWRHVAFDRMLWKDTKKLCIEGKNPCSAMAKKMIKLSKNLEELFIARRNDLEDILEYNPDETPMLRNLEMIHCSSFFRYRFRIRNALCNIIHRSPKLKVFKIEYSQIRSKAIYRALAENFHKLETVIITNTTKSEMKFFVEVLRINEPSLQFRNESMMGRADGKRIYWGRVLGLSIRPATHMPYLSIPRITYNNLDYV